MHLVYPIVCLSTKAKLPPSLKDSLTLVKSDDRNPSQYLIEELKENPWELNSIWEMFGGPWSCLFLYKGIPKGMAIALQSPIALQQPPLAHNLSPL